MSEENEFEDGLLTVPRNGEHPGEDRGVLWRLTAAFQFLTRLPFPGSPACVPLTGCVVFFPLVGAMIGTCTFVVAGIGCLLWPVWLAVWLSLAVEARLTGALHEDALADFADGFGGGWTREDVLAIFKDSRVGTYGTLALLFAVVLRAGAMIALVTRSGPENWWVWGSVVVASAAIGRWAMVVAMVCLAPVSRRDSLSRVFADRLGCRDLFCASLWCLAAVAPFAVFLPRHFLFAIVLLGFALWLLIAGVRKKLGGVTGDCLGCVCYVGQVVVLLAAAAKLEPWMKVL